MKAVTIDQNYQILNARFHFPIYSSSNFEYIIIEWLISNKLIIILCTTSSYMHAIMQLADRSLHLITNWVKIYPNWRDLYMLLTLVIYHLIFLSYSFFFNISRPCMHLGVSNPGLDRWYRLRWYKNISPT